MKNTAQQTFIEINIPAKKYFVPYIVYQEGERVKKLSSHTFEDRYVKPSKHLEFFQGEFFPEKFKFIGIFVKKNVLDLYDIYDADGTTGRGFFCSKKLKKIIESNKLTGCYFTPVWFESFSSQKLSKPDAYLISSSNKIPSRKSWEVFKKEEKHRKTFIAVPDNFKSELEDFNTAGRCGFDIISKRVFDLFVKNSVRIRYMNLKNYDIDKNLVQFFPAGRINENYSKEEIVDASPNILSNMLKRCSKLGSGSVQIKAQ